MYAPQVNYDPRYSPSFEALRLLELSRLEVEKMEERDFKLDFHVSPHLLRHTYITNLIYEGVDPKTVQYLAGHENSKVTMDIYAKVKYNKPKELVQVVNQAFNLPNQEK